MTRDPATLSRFAGLLTLCTWGLIVFGASVRVHGAGLACPDWPLCFGEVIPPIDFQVFLEFGHRVVAGVISLGFALLAAAAYRARARVSRRTFGWIVAAAVTLVVQIVLGGLTVLELLAEWTVTSHLLAGNTFCMTLLMIALSLRESEGGQRRVQVGPWARPLSAALAVLVPTQLALGGLVASSYAGLVCPDWPTCDGTNWFPTFEGLVGIQLSHRLLAYAVLAVAAAAAALTRGGARPFAGAVFAIACTQAAIGVANVWLRLPVEVTLLHSAGGAATWLLTAWLNWEVWRSPWPEATRPAVPAEAR